MKIHVGSPDHEEFVVHEYILRRSEFMKRALNGSWEESKSRTIAFPEDDPEEIGLYLHYLYTNRMPVINAAEFATTTSSDTIETCVHDLYIKLAETYVIAEKLQDTSTKNAVMRELYSLNDTKQRDGIWYAPSIVAVSIIFEGTHPNSAARRFVVDAWKDVKILGEKQAVKVMPKEFYVMVAVALQAKVGEDLDDKMCKVEEYLEEETASVSS